MRLQVIDDVDLWGMDLFHLFRVTDQHPLVAVFMTVFDVRLFSSLHFPSHPIYSTLFSLSLSSLSSFTHVRSLTHSLFARAPF